MTIKTDVELKRVFGRGEPASPTSMPEVPERIRAHAPTPTLRPGGRWAPLADAVDREVREAQDAARARRNEWAARISGARRGKELGFGYRRDDE
jgi:hypothetical protein